MNVGKFVQAYDNTLSLADSAEAAMILVHSLLNLSNMVRKQIEYLHSRRDLEAQVERHERLFPVLVVEQADLLVCAGHQEATVRVECK